MSDEIQLKLRQETRDRDRGIGIQKRGRGVVFVRLCGCVGRYEHFFVLCPSVSPLSTGTTNPVISALITGFQGVGDVFTLWIGFILLDVSGLEIFVWFVQ